MMPLLRSCEFDGNAFGRVSLPVPPSSSTCRVWEPLLAWPDAFVCGQHSLWWRVVGRSKILIHRRWVHYSTALRTDLRLVVSARVEARFCHMQSTFTTGIYVLLDLGYHHEPETFTVLFAGPTGHGSHGVAATSHTPRLPSPSGAQQLMRTVLIWQVTVMSRNRRRGISPSYS